MSMEPSAAAAIPKSCCRGRAARASASTAMPPRSGAAAPWRKKLMQGRRSFQALRIAVNNELGELEAGLEACERVLNPHGRLAVVAFHSLEDRIVKQFLAERTGRLGHGSRHAPSQAPKHAATFASIGKNPNMPQPEELRANPRARSARLRGAERSKIPAWNSPPRIAGEHA